jgi:hypothetical protein
LSPFFPESSSTQKSKLWVAPTAHAVGFLFG